MAPKYMQVEQDIRRRIAAGDFRAGEALPTYQALGREYNVALLTIKRALDRLREQGVVWSRQGSGIYVADPEVKGEKRSTGATYGLARLSTPHDTHLLFDSVVPVLHEVVNGAGGELAVRYFEAGQDDAVCDWVPQHAGVVLCGSIHENTLRQVAALQPNVVMAGYLGEGQCPEGIPQFSADIPRLMELGMGCLTRLGHRRILFVNRSGSNYWRELGHCFLHKAHERSIAREASELVLARTDDEKAIVGHVVSCSPMPTALFVEGGERASRLILHLARNGFLVPEDVSVLAISTAGLVRAVMPEMSYVSLNVEAQFRAAVWRLVHQARAAPIRRRRVRPDLVKGATVRNIVGEEGSGTEMAAESALFLDRTQS